MRHRPRLRCRLAALIGLLAIALPCTAGCTQLLSINDDALVVGAGLDTGTQPGSVAVHLQWFHHGAPSGSAGGSITGGGGGPGSSHIMTLAGSAPDVAAAVADVRQQTDQRVVFSETDLLLLGDGLARRGVADALAYFWRDGNFPETAQVAVTRGRTGRLLASRFPGGIAMELQRRLVRSERTDTGSIPIPFWRFLARLSASGIAAWAPVFAPAPKGFRADGTALFSGDRMTGEISQSETAALSWLVKSGGYADLLLPQAVSGGEPVALRVRSRTLGMSVAGAGHARLDVRLQTSVRQGWNVLLQGRNPGALDAAAAGQAKRDIRAVLDRLQAAGSDVLGLGELLRERDPAAVRDWPQTFHHMRIALRVEVTVLPSGRQA